MSQQPLHFVPTEDFRARARAALDDPKLRKSFRGAMDFLQQKRAVQFPTATSSSTCATSAKPCASTRWPICPTCWSNSKAI
jgi:hypothetical protein